MRILMISDVYRPRINGVSTSIETFRHDLLAMGHEVTLVVPDYGGTELEDGVIRVEGRPVPRDAEDRIMSWRHINRRLNELAEQPWHVVHTHTPFVAHYAGARFASHHRVPRVISYHTWFESFIEHYAPTVLAGMLRSVSRWCSVRQCLKADAVITPSTAMAGQLGAYGAPTSRQYVLPTGLSSADLAPGDGAAFRRMHGIGRDRPMALFAGRVAHEKNIAFLVDAFRQVRDAIPQALLVIVGDGPARTSVREHAARRGVEDGVHFTGYLPRGVALPAAYAAADLFVFASRTETQGLVLLEAMAQGTPVLAVAEMGTCEVLDGCPGAVIASGEVEEFARQWIALLQDARRRTELSFGAHATARAWQNHHMATRLVDLYASLIRRHRSPAPAESTVDGWAGGEESTAMGALHKSHLNRSCSGQR